MAQEVDEERRRVRAGQLKERIYVTFIALGVVLALTSYDPVDAAEALSTLLVTALGTVLAVFVADVISQLVVHEQVLTRVELGRAVVISFGASSSIVLPVLFLFAAVLRLWSTETALWASSIALIVALIAIGYAAIRRIPMHWWQRLIALGAEALLALAVVGLKVLAHG